MLAALQCCHLIITISGLSVALLILAQTVLGALQGCHSVITTLLQTAASGDSLSLAPASIPQARTRYLESLGKYGVSQGVSTRT